MLGERITSIYPPRDLAGKVAAFNHNQAGKGDRRPENRRIRTERGIS